MSSGAAWRLLGFGVLSVTSYATVVILARQFGPETYGVYGLVYAVLASCELILRLGLPQAMIRSVSRDSDGAAGIASNGTVLLVGTNLVAFGVLWLLAPALAELLNITNGGRLLRIALLDLPCYAAYLALTAVLSGRFDFKWVGIATMVYGLSRLLAVMLLVGTGNLTVEAALVANVLASVCGVLVILLRVGLVPICPSRAMASSLVALAIPISFGEVAMVLLTSMDLWLLNALDPALAPEQRGYYVAALSLARVPNALGVVLVGVMIPMLARSRAVDPPRETRRLVLDGNRMLMLALIPSCVIGSANAGDLLALFYSDAYVEAQPIMMLLLFSHGGFLTALICLQGMLIAGDRSAAGGMRVYAGVGLAIVAGFVLVPGLSAVGAAAGALLALAAATTLVALEVRRSFGALIEPAVLIKIVVLTLPLALLSHWWHSAGVGLIVELTLVACAYLGGCWRLGLYPVQGRRRHADNEDLRVAESPDTGQGG